MERARIRRRTAALAAAAVTFAIAVVAPATPAQAEPEIQRKIDAQLAAYPGGTQLNDNEVAYAGGTFVITFAANARSNRNATEAAAPMDCPSGWFCFYEDVNWGYPRGRLSSCGWQDLSWWGWQNRTESAQYNLSTGHVTFLNAGTSQDQPIFDIGVSRRSISDVAPYRNTADRVFRYC